MAYKKNKDIANISNDEITEKVTKMACNLFLQQENMSVTINPMEDLFGEHKLDSFSMVQLVLEVEVQFNIEFSDNELNLEILSTPKSIADLISNKLNQMRGEQNV